MRLLVGFVLLILLVPCVTVQGHTPNVMMSILKEDGPTPADIVETAGFVEGDGVKFKMSDSSNNSSMRISIDLDKDCLLYTSPSPRDSMTSRMPSSA